MYLFFASYAGQTQNQVQPSSVHHTNGKSGFRHWTSKERSLPAYNPLVVIYQQKLIAFQHSPASRSEARDSQLFTC